YAITAIIGRREIMECAQSSFISSTFWTERIGPAAGIKTLEVMERTRSYDQITETGREIGRRWRRLAEKHQLSVQLTGLPALITFGLGGHDTLAYKTLITQEMLKKGFVASTSVYVCIEHTPDVIERYFDALDPIFAMIRECEDGRPVEELLNGPICHSMFHRIN